MPLSMKLAVAYLVLACLAPVANAQGTNGWADVVKQFDAYVAADRIVGASILYMRDGKVVARHNVGYADREANAWWTTRRSSTGGRHEDAHVDQTFSWYAR